MKSADIKRFWSKVKKPIGDGCWIWSGSKKNFGHRYDQITIDGDTISAHRFSWIIHNGPITDNLCVLHKCDNPPCVNPSHLFLGTQKDNIQDCIKKMRKHCVLGIKHPNHKLTENQVKEIKFGNSPKSQIECAKLYDIDQSIISSIRNGKRWKHIVAL